MTVLRVLITRPELDAARTAVRLSALGHRVIVDPILRVESIAGAKIPDDPFDALAATSANAMRVLRGMAAPGIPRTVPLFAVGERTAEAANEAGFETVIASAGDAAALARLLSERLERGSRVVHLAGEERAQDLAALLEPAGIAVDVVPLYRAVAAEALGTATVAALAAAELDAVLHYSRRSAATFVWLAAQQGLVNAILSLRHLCLSAAVAEPLASIGARVEVAVRSDEAALLDLLGG